MNKTESLNHTKWDFKYHIVFIPKGPKKVLHRQLRMHVGEVFRALAHITRETGSKRVIRWPITCSIPPKNAVSKVVGYIKGKSAIHLARVYAERKRNFAGQSFWARGYFVSTVGRDADLIRNYIREQEKEDARLKQLGLWR